ncbi:MAG: hypothetical protein ACETWC_07070 [Acidobacteriota bacterium]
MRLFSLALVVGLGLMVFSGLYLAPRSPVFPYSYALELVTEGEELPPQLKETLREYDYLKLTNLYPLEDGRYRLLRMMLIGRSGRREARSREALLRGFQLRVAGRLVVLESPGQRLGVGMLAQGRLPEPRKGEVVVGYGLKKNVGERISISRREFQVVGIFQPRMRLFHKAIVAHSSPFTAPLLEDEGLERVTSFVFDAPSLTELQQLSTAVRQHLPSEEGFSLFTHLRSLSPGAFYLYYGGLLLLLIGGVGGIWEILRWMGRKLKPGRLHSAVQMVIDHRRKYWAVNGVYFGLALIVALFIYSTPAVQDFITHLVQQSIQSGKGMLGWAGRAYASGIIPYAALVTFVVNSFVGAFVYLVLPSLVIPGSGLLMGLVRSLSWGLLLSPTTESLAGAMIPGSFTVLLEGEAYVLCMFFVYLMVRGLVKGEGTLGERYRRGVGITLRGFLLVLLVLAAAALYEATEVILLIR